MVAHADRDAVLALMTTLRDDPRFAFEQVMDICGVDWPERAERFDVVYNLLSVSLNQRLRVIVTTDENDAGAVGAHGVAGRDLVGARGLGPVRHRVLRPARSAAHPDRLRIRGHPLRKDFPLTGYVEVRYDEDRKAVVYEPVRLTQDFRIFDFLSPWEAITTLPGDEKVHTARAAEAQPPSETKA